ncbi:MAG: (2Fe-2S)-binding protein [Gammaproteobacteria bacterium]
MIKLTINGEPRQLDSNPDMPLLWAIRDVLGLTGTKFGCGKGLCGSCTVHLQGRAVRSCVTPLAAAADKAVTTIEGLSEDGGGHPLQQAWVAEEVPQCGYCQSGQIMSAAAFLKQNPKPSDAAIRSSMQNLCRCGTYQRIFRAIKRASGQQP